MEKRDAYTKTDVINIEEAQRERREKRAQALKVRRRKVKVAKVEAEKARRSFITGRRLILVSVTVAVVFFVGSSVFRIIDLKTQEEKATELLKVKTEQQARLEGELLMLKDKEYIEEQARERLGMVKPGEVVYVFDDGDSADAKSGGGGAKSDTDKAGANDNADADDGDATSEEVAAADADGSDSGE
jgi:cell division protein FtsB